MTEEEAERLRRVVREMRAELYAMRALMPVLAGMAAVSQPDPKAAIRDMHLLATANADTMIGEEAGPLREQVATALDRLLTGVSLTRMED